ncbi:MAG: VanZ family protein [Oceanicoccus sp.]|jgi:VanZ family protein
MSLLTFSRCCLVVAFLAITLLALSPQDKVIIDAGWDKANHAVAFFVLLLLLDLSLPNSEIWRRKVLPLLIYGVLIEVLQSLTVGRYSSALDVLANAVGLLLYLPLRPYILSCVARISDNYSSGGNT